MIQGVFLLGMGCSILLEVYDFPDLRQGLVWLADLGSPISEGGGGSEVGEVTQFWGGLDAHALWHAATALITPVWYSFCEQDSDDPSRARGRGDAVAGAGAGGSE